jgi:hypothetical protein
MQGSGAWVNIVFVSNCTASVLKPIFSAAWLIPSSDTPSLLYWL